MYHTLMKGIPSDPDKRLRLFEYLLEGNLLGSTVCSGPCARSCGMRTRVRALAPPRPNVKRVDAGRRVGALRRLYAGAVVQNPPPPQDGKQRIVFWGGWNRPPAGSYRPTASACPSIVGSYSLIFVSQAPTAVDYLPTAVNVSSGADMPLSPTKLRPRRFSFPFALPTPQNSPSNVHRQRRGPVIMSGCRARTSVCLKSYEVRSLFEELPGPCSSAGLRNGMGGGAMQRPVGNCSTTGVQCHAFCVTSLLVGVDSVALFDAGCCR